MVKIHADTERLLAAAPPDVRRFSGHLLICYFADEPDPGSVEVRCENCGRPEMLGPKSVNLRKSNPRRFHALCVVCGLAVVKLRSYSGNIPVIPEVHRPDDWPWL